MSTWAYTRNPRGQGVLVPPLTTTSPLLFLLFPDQLFRQASIMCIYHFRNNDRILMEREVLGSLANVCYHSYSWKLGRPPKPHIIPKACGQLAASQGLLFRDCVALSNNDVSLPSGFACLVTILPWEMEGCIKARESVSGYFFPFSLGWVLFWHLVYTHIN